MVRMCIEVETDQILRRCDMSPSPQAEYSPASPLKGGAR